MRDSFQLASINISQLVALEQGFKYILVVMDHYICFAQAYATKNKSPKTVADKLFNDFALSFGFPEMIHHDKGRVFKKTADGKGCKNALMYKAPTHLLSPKR